MKADSASVATARHPASAWSAAQQAALLLRLAPPLACAIAYFCAARIGEWLAFPGAPVSAFWAPNAILLAALVLAPRERWWIYLLAVLPLHLLAQAPDFPMARVILQYIFNCGEALLGAWLLQRLAVEPRRFDRLRTTAVLIVFAAVLVPLLTSMLMVGAFELEGLSDQFWLTVAARTITNTFAILTLVPLIVHGAAWLRAGTRSVPLWSGLEGLAAALLLGAIGLLIFVMPWEESLKPPALLYAPLPVLVWCAVRFGISGMCLSALLLGLLSTWGVLDGSSPFSGQNPMHSVLSLVSFQVVTCIPMLLLAALIEERRHTTQALHTSETRFRSIFQNNIVATAIWCDAGHFSESNESFLRLTGFTRAELEAGAVRCAELSDFWREWEQRTAGSQEAARIFGPAEIELRLRDGRVVPVMVGACPFGAGREGGVLYALDLSEFRRVEAARQLAENLHTAVLTSLHDQVAVLDRNGVVLETNDSWQRFTASAQAPAFHCVLNGDNLVQACILANRQGDPVASELLAAIRGVLEGLSSHRQLEFALPSGNSVTWFELSVEELRRPEGGAVITRTDVTGRKQAEIEARNQRQQLTHLGRAAVLGQLSGAFAHELNQPLTSILGNAEAGLRLLAQDKIDPVELREILRDIVHDDERAAQVIQRLRALLRKGELQRHPVSMNSVVREVLSLSRSDLITRNVTVLSELDPRLPLVLADRVQMQQVMLNLVINACEAMADMPPRQRRLAIVTRYVADTDVVELTVRDAGSGIATGEFEHIFQPFVTTKKHGLGLGLAICRSIVESHGGGLWAESPPGGGALLHLTVPADGDLGAAQDLAQLPA